MTLQIYNSLSGKKEEFKPITPGEVKLYVCGNTVYDSMHIGHARSLIVFDIIVRYLIYLGYRVQYVRNITDIDDKILERALRENKTFQELSEYFIKEQSEEYEALNLWPFIEPRVTQYIEQIKIKIALLLENKSAYLKNGDVYFDIASFKEYGKLTNRGFPCGSDFDFVIWKSGDFWDAPWGKGRPAWHIECCVMSIDCLGQPFDIHGGGLDLKFPHHENEIAQAEVLGKPLANYWMHAGLVTINGKKMSKSDGNSITLKYALYEEGWSRNELRLFFMNSHYRRPVDYKDSSLFEARSLKRKIIQSLRNPRNGKFHFHESEACYQFKKAMDNDFNTHEALLVIRELCHSISASKSELKIMELSDNLRTILGICGIYL